ncbi:glyoxalase superfamily protein [Aquimarina gracilis]|uniref:Glyoxalase superfamily protein n=1 Tax=Aquimarina gracilis TaxID=874422 RepID=A0ABU5ZT47_9FLAO|nr:glyoxalase superfamily protein [Aquimarina gracilis]MEB3344747.1 glyoxalase superfamily protein [Aquimarina gracilis]
MSKLFLHAACVLPVSDMKESIHFYVNKLDFKVTFSWNKPIDYAVLNRENVELHLTLKEGYKKGKFHYSSLYIFVNAIESIYEELISKKVLFNRGLGEQEYGMSDFNLADPDGHIITFGQTLKK